MLDMMRRARKHLSIILWLLIVILAAGMVLLFVDRPGLTNGPVGHEAVADVEGHAVTAREFRQAYARTMDMYRQAYNLNAANAGLLKALGLEKQVLNQLIASQVVLLEAGKMGITATDDEVFNYIRKIPAFQDNGNFIGPSRYEQILRANNLNAADFEEGIRKDIIREKFQSVITDSIAVSPDEVKNEYVQRNQEAVIEFVSFDPAQVEKTLQPSDADLKAFYEQNKARYKVGEQRKIDVMIFDAGQLGGQAKISNEELQRRFQANPGEEEVKASHILLESKDPAKDAEVKAKAEKILKEARSGADFAKLAKQYSQDPGSKVNGGDLGYFPRERMVPEFASVAFSLPPGQISDLVKTQFGYHIIKVIDKRMPNFENRRTILEIEARREQGEKLAEQQANKAYADLTNAKKDFNTVAREYGAVIQTTDYFTQDQPVPKLGTPAEFSTEIFLIKKKGDLGKPFKAWRGWLIPRLLDVMAPHQQDFVMVKDKVLADYKREKSQDFARQRAFDVANLAKDGNLEAAAKKYSATVTVSKPFKKDAAVEPGLGANPQVSSKAFSMTPGQVSQAVQVESKYVVFKLKEKSQVDMAKFEAEKDALRQSLQSQKRTNFFSSYLSSLVEKRRAENKITVNQTLIDQITG
ncbi:MAG TPA: peptidylprolyl isomerase [Acidobacteriota bacterium]|jgi:peptidyl-prolyl cis-trans isomerase D